MAKRNRWAERIHEDTRQADLFEPKSNRIGLVACCSDKLDMPEKAKHLYQSPLFRLSMRWIKKRVDEWGILSAKHGLVLPDQVIRNYNVSLSSMTRAEKEAWARRTQAQIVGQWGRDQIYLVLVGEDYKAAVRGLPYVEDVTACWTKHRRNWGMTGRRASVGIGVMLKYLKEDRGYY